MPASYTIPKDEGTKVFDSPNLRTWLSLIFSHSSGAPYTPEEEMLVLWNVPSQQTYNIDLMIGKEFYLVTIHV